MCNASSQSSHSLFTFHFSLFTFGIGGGEVGRDELIAAKRSGKEVHFISAEMNHQKARDNAQKKGLPMPTHFNRAASEALTKHF